ncbi:MAG: hypothetical protein QM736_18645 [Vicinamibacterales bacterium]
MAEDRKRFSRCCGTSAFRSRQAARPCRATRRARSAANIGFPVVVRPSYVLGGRAMAIVYDMASLDRYMAQARRRLARAPDSHRQVPRGCLRARRRLPWPTPRGAVVIGGIMEHIEEAGIHSGDSSCVVPPFMLRRTPPRTRSATTRAASPAPSRSSA